MKKSVGGIPRRTYYVTYHGVVIHIENNMVSALGRVPRVTRGWRITYLFHNDPDGTAPRTAFQGAW